MNNRIVSIALLFIGLSSWWNPSFNGFMLEAVNVSDGEGRIAGAIFIVGAAIVWFQRE